MNKLLQRAALGAAFVLASAGASAAATVTFGDMEKMTDVPRFQVDRENLEWHLQEHFDKLAAKLPAGQTLKIDVLDIDLAGDQFPRIASMHYRVLRGRADWPHIHLRYTIEQDGKVVSSGERHVKDMNYLMGINRYNSDMYSHEKQMLDDWFRKEVVAAR